jgi:hypothetical protein
LAEGLTSWHLPDQFTDAKVAQVKEVFKIVFRLPPETNLVGSAVSDAIILQPAGNNHKFYALTRPETDDTIWEMYILETQGLMSWTRECEFRLILLSMAQSSQGELGVTDIVDTDNVPVAI